MSPLGRVAALRSVAIPIATCRPTRLGGRLAAAGVRVRAVVRSQARAVAAELGCGDCGEADGIFVADVTAASAGPVCRGTWGPLVPCPFCRNLLSDFLPGVCV